MGKLFLTSEAYLSLDKIIAKLHFSPEKYKLLFVPTAADGEDGDKIWLKADKDALITAGFKLTELNISHQIYSDLEQAVATTDVLFISGGNAFYLLQELRRTGFDKLIVKFVTQRGIYIGSSAGSVIVGPDITHFKYLDEPSRALGLEDYNSLNITSYAVLPHWAEEKFHSRYMKSLELVYQNKDLFPVILKDKQVLYLHGNQAEIL